MTKSPETEPVKAWALYRDDKLQEIKTNERTTKSTRDLYQGLQDLSTNPGPQWAIVKGTFVPPGYRVVKIKKGKRK